MKGKRIEELWRMSRFGSHLNKLIIYILGYQVGAVNSPSGWSPWPQVLRALFFFLNEALETAAVVMATERRLASSGFIHTFVCGLYQATG